ENGRLHHVPERLQPRFNPVGRQEKRRVRRGRDEACPERSDFGPRRSLDDPDLHSTRCVHDYTDSLIAVCSSTQVTWFTKSSRIPGKCRSQSIPLTHSSFQYTGCNPHPLTIRSNLRRVILFKPFLTSSYRVAPSSRKRRRTFMTVC